MKFEKTSNILDSYLIKIPLILFVRKQYNLSFMKICERCRKSWLNIRTQRYNDTI